MEKFNYDRCTGNHDVATLNVECNSFLRYTANAVFLSNAEADFANNAHA